MTEADHRLVLGRVVSAVAAVAAVSPVSMFMRDRGRDVIRARWVAIWLLRELTRLSTIRVGYLFDGIDHSTVLNACRHVDSDRHINGPLWQCAVLAFRRLYAEQHARVRRPLGRVEALP